MGISVFSKAGRFTSGGTLGFKLFVTTGFIKLRPRTQNGLDEIENIFESAVRLAV